MHRERYVAFGDPGAILNASGGPSAKSPVKAKQLAFTPTQTRLECVQEKSLEYFSVIKKRSPPLRVMVLYHFLATQ